MPDLGKYTDVVLGAYGASFTLLIALVALSVWRARAARAALAEVEARVKGNRHG